MNSLILYTKSPLAVKATFFTEWLCNLVEQEGAKPGDKRKLKWSNKKGYAEIIIYKIFEDSASLEGDHFIDNSTFCPTLVEGI